MLYNICYMTSKPRLNNPDMFVMLQYLCYILTKSHDKGMLHSTNQPSRCRNQEKNIIARSKLSG